MDPRRPSTYEARVWKTETYVGKEISSHTVRWRVGSQRWKKTFRTAAQAESFRSKLIAAVRDGEAFDIETGQPVSMVRGERSTTSWYEFACSVVDAKWPDISPNHRRGTADVLTAATTALLAEKMPTDPVKAMAIRSALKNWAFNARRGSADQPAEVTALLEWVARKCPDVGELADQRRVRAVLASFKVNLDGARAAGRTVTWRRSVFTTVLNHAVDDEHLVTNPVASMKRKGKTPKAREAVDRRCVANPSQARLLLASVANTPRSGKRLVAFFGVIYYAAVRPEEAVELRRGNLDLPAEGWGWITLESAAPEVDKHWADSGVRHEPRELKHRAVGETRRVPCPPELTALLHAHLRQFPTGKDGRLFCGERGGVLANVTYMRLWRRARAAVLTEAQCASPLAARPYDLRHAAVSTWLNGGVGPTQVAEWAGHSVTILLRIYAKCLDGQESTALLRIQDALK
jgi:integrase